MPNYSELYSLPTVSALSFPHYNSSSLSYINYSKPLSRYPGVYKPHLSTISEISSPYRRLNTPKLTYPTDISSRTIKPIKVINTADIDVSVNRYKKYEKKTPRIKQVEPKPYIQEQPLEVVKESKPKPTIRRDRATVRIRTVHADTVKEEIGAFKTWRDNFEPNELTNEVKTRKKTKGEILKEKFLIRSRSKENIAAIVETPKKYLPKKTSSFRDICTAITLENISDDLNPGQPVEIQRRQSRSFSSENLLKDIRRVSTEISQEDLNILNSILSSQEETESSDESVVSVNLSDFKYNSSNNEFESSEKSENEVKNIEVASEDDKNKVTSNLEPVKIDQDDTMRDSGQLNKSKSDLNIRKRKKDSKTSDAFALKRDLTLPDILSKKDKIVKHKTNTDGTNVLKKNLKDSGCTEDSKLKPKLKQEMDKVDSTKNVQATTENKDSQEEIKPLTTLATKLPTNLKKKGEEVTSKLQEIAPVLKKEEKINSDSKILSNESKYKEKGKEVGLKIQESAPVIKEQEKKINSGSKLISTGVKPESKEVDLKLKKLQVEQKANELKANILNKKMLNEQKLKAKEAEAEVKSSVEVLKKDNRETISEKYDTSSTINKKEEIEAKDNSKPPETPKDISNVEIQEIKFKIKPVITGSVEDIVVPKKTLVARVDKVEVEVEKPPKTEKKLKVNAVINVQQAKQQEKLNKGIIAIPKTETGLENIIIQKQNVKQNCKTIKELKPKVKKKNNNHEKNISKCPNLTSVAEDGVEEPPSKATTVTEELTSTPDTTEEKSTNMLKSNQRNKDCEEAETSEAAKKKESIKIISKRSLLKKPTKDDPDLEVFIPPPEPEPEPEPEQEEKKEAFVPLQSNRLTQWMHPWAKPEQFDECPVEIFARPKIIKGRHYPRPRKRNSNAAAMVPTTSEDNDSNDSDSEDNTSTEDTSASLRSNDSGFGSTVPEKLNVSQREAVTTNTNEPDIAEEVFIPPTDKIIPPATTIPRFKKYAVDDFDFLKVLGKGSFGKVLLAKLTDTDYYYAVKCLKKDVIVEDNDVECTLIERKVLALGTRHPFLCHLLCTFQTESHLFFVMEYLNGGDLMFHITTGGSFPEEQAQFYAAEIISGLQFLHNRGIIYRDLKLDNILLDFDGHARLADFGMCQLQIFLDRMAESFCGTPDYMAPEIIKGQHYNQAVDWWSFGVLLYEMFLGQSPFSGCDEDELFWSICNEKPVIPKELSTYATDILTKLLEKDQSKRLGTRFSPHGLIRDHNFFRHLDWNALEARQLEPPFKPNLRHPLDTQYFDTNFTKEAVKITPITEVQILETIDQSQFQGFSYTNPNATDK
ncbi:uncharacterized protein [Diabrotica undecimpunctata]|uniref:uncharacterized protein n=1 Tax=Diabrotica undecimpunctata TaxID=50387 RepID=UPI003B642637